MEQWREAGKREKEKEKRDGGKERGFCSHCGLCV
jgi:hypothetical protein